MRHVIEKMIRYIPHLALIVAICIPLASSATTVKALSFAINEANTSGDRTPIKTYMATNDVDFGAFDCAKSDGYFINSAFSQNGKNFKVNFYNASWYKFFVWDSDKYDLMNTPSTDRISDNSMIAVFQDEFDSQYALISLRGSYTAASAKTNLDAITRKFPHATLIVTYNERIGTSNANTLHASLTNSVSGPGMFCLGRTNVNDTAVGGVYMYPTDVPSSYSVELVSKSIGTKYNGTLATLEFPTKYKVIFNDWDGTGLQTNVVVAGGSVTPPTPVREGYAFIGWDHDASEFETVTESFTATAQYDEPVLTVMGLPENIGTADPAYGITNGLVADASFTASVVLPDAEPNATERWACAGYTHYQITDFDQGTRVVVQEGTSDSFTYVHAWRDELVWHFTNEWLVTASASVGGSVSAVETWVRNGTAVALTAIPDDGYDFWRWQGDTDGVADVTAATISPAITAGRTLYAVFTPTGVADPSVQYVSTAGDNGNNGYSAESPKLTVQAAINALAVAPGYGTVYVAAGTYASSAGIVVTNAIEILGATGNPEGVIIRNTSTSSGANVITLRLNHPDAFVANIAIENGHRYQQSGAPFGANLAIESRGGTVSNCIIRGGSWNGMYVRGLGAWLNSANALLTHCVITNNNASGASQQPGDSGDLAFGGMFVDIAKGTVANCLIANNRDTGGSGAVANWRQSQTCGVTVRDGGRLINCTVVTNEARYTGGIYLTAKGVATNVVVAGCVNKCTYTNGLGKVVYTDIGFKGTIANASHCASDGGEALNSTCIAGTAEEFFADMAGRDYRPAANSPLVNSGATYDGIAEIDLLGKNRVQGRFVDIGAYESSSRGFYIIVR